MKTIHKILFFLLLAAPVTTGCHPRALRGGAGTKAQLTAGNTVDSLFASYRKYNREDFSALVSDDFVPSKNDFINAAEKGFYGAAVLELSYVIMIETRSSPDTRDIGVKWEKKTLAAGKAEPLLRIGEAELTFNLKNGDWLLYSLSGNDPFAAP
jgi:hypothetical protein